MLATPVTYGAATMPDVSIREAADRLGVSIDTVRRRVRSGALPATKGSRAGDPYVVHLDDGHPEPPTTTEADVLRELVAVLREQVAVKDREIAALHRLLDQAIRPGRRS